MLDIGGGTTGTSYIFDYSDDCWLLDPFVETVNTKFAGRIDWENEMKFDVIVARGCFYYLSESQIKKIPTMLNPNGVFVANIFRYPTTGEREYETLDGEYGLEKWTFEDGIVTHELHPKNKNVIYTHQFVYRSWDEICKLLDGVSRYPYKKNSCLLTLGLTSRKVLYNT